MRLCYFIRATIHMGVVLFHGVVLHGDLLQTVSVTDSQIFELWFVEQLELHVSRR